MWAGCQYSPQLVWASLLRSCYTNSPLPPSPSPPDLLFHCQCSLSPPPSLFPFCTHTHTQGYLFFHWVEPQCQVKASIGRIKRVAGVRSQGPHSAQQTLKRSGGLEFQTKCPLIHYTCNCTENLLPQHHIFSLSSPHLSLSLSLLGCSLSLLRSLLTSSPHHHLFFFFFPPPPRQSIHKA